MSWTTIPIMNTEPSNNTLQKTKHARSSIVNYRVRLDPVATSCVLGWVKRTCNNPGQILSNYITQQKGTLLWHLSEILRQRFRLETSFRVSVKRIEIAKCDLCYHYCDAKEIPFYYFGDTNFLAKHEEKKKREFHLYCWDHIFKINEWCLVDCFRRKFKLSLK